MWVQKCSILTALLYDVASKRLEASKSGAIAVGLDVLDVQATLNHGMRDEGRGNLASGK